jgi:hypothetical protein
LTSDDFAEGLQMPTYAPSVVKMVAQTVMRFIPNKVYNDEDICNLLKEHRYYPVLFLGVFTNAGWHFWGMTGQPDHIDSILFVENGTRRVLYIAIDHRTAMFNAFDSFEHACSERPVLSKQLAEVVNSLSRIAADKIQKELIEADKN